MGVHHVAYATADLDATHRFYTEVMGFSLVITQYLQTYLGYTPLQSGLLVLPWSVTVMPMLSMRAAPALWLSTLGS